MSKQIKKLLCIVFFAGFGLLCADQTSAQGLTFTTNTYSVGSGPLITVADVNGDGRLDLITANFNTNTLTVLTNDGSGSFGFYATLIVGKFPGYTVAADLNENGKLELVSMNVGDNTLTVLTNNGSGTFGSNATLNVGNSLQAVAVADTTGNGKEDLISLSAGNPSTLTVLTNNGSGGFGFNATLTCGKSATGFAAADLNCDGYIDLVTANFGANTLTILTNNGHGIFGLNATLTVGPSPQFVIVADVNADGKPDLICANNGTNTLTVLTNNGNGIFGFSSTFHVGGKPFYIAATDLNGDGSLDLVSANAGAFPSGNGNTLTVLTNNGGGIFSSNTTLNVGSTPYFAVAADLNADGRPDLIASNFKNNTVTVLLNTSIFPSPQNTPSLTVKNFGEFISITWPTFSPGWSLQENSDLSKTNWWAVGFDGFPIIDGGATQPISDDGTNKSVTLPIASGNKFFRLLHP